MRRNLPIKRTKKHNIIINAVFDYFGTGAAENEKSQAKLIALFLMNRRKGIQLSEEQKSIACAIRENLKDKTYTTSLN